MNSIKNYFLLGMAGFLLMACGGNQKEPEVALTKSGLNPQNFVAEINGKQTQLVTLTNANGMEVCFHHESR